MQDFKGYVQVYTGNGKGKTTAALGLCVRAAGAKMNVYIAQFMKLGEYGEVEALKSLSKFIKFEQFGLGEFIYSKPSKKEIQAAQAGIASVREKSSSGKYHVVVMEEINVAISCGLITLSSVLEIINQKADSTELVLTGRGAKPQIIEIADLVTDMVEVKHYYQKGIHAREGIEQ